MVDDAVCCEPLSTYKFPVKQGSNREFRAFSPLRWSLARSKRAGFTEVFPQIPYSTEQGILSIEQRIFSAEQGIFREEPGTYNFFAVERSFGSAKGVGPSRRLAGEGLITLQNECPPSPWRWRARRPASSAHCSRAAITIGQQSLPTRATKQPDQTLLLKEHVSPWVVEVVLSVMGNRSDRRFPNRPVSGPSRPLR